MSAPGPRTTEGPAAAGPFVFHDGAARARREFLGVAFDAIGLDEALAAIAARPDDAPFAYIVTPNVDHLVRLEREPAGGEVRRAYAGAAWCLCDSRVLARLARLAGVALTVAPGSDLTARLLAERVARGDRLCLIGGDAAMRDALAARLPGNVLLQHAPPMGFRHDPAAMAAAARFVAKARARYVLLAVGSPQQELLALAIVERGDASGMGLCIGASIEFVTGTKARAPLWMRRAGIEWAHRLASEPRRLWRRYLVEGPRIFAMTLRWKRRR